MCYVYDGSFYGVLCCIKLTLKNKMMPESIVSAEETQISFFDAVYVDTNLESANEIMDLVVNRVGREGLLFLKEAFLTCLDNKALRMVEFVVLGLRYGASVLKMLAHDTVHALNSAVGHMHKETHLLKGFVRFSQQGDLLWAEIEPKNMVLSLLAPHFCTRLPEEKFVICDKTHGLALIYAPYQPEIVEVPKNLPRPEISRLEAHYQKLWKLFYDTIEIEGRHNPLCRRSHMPKRYWGCTVELRNS